MTTVVLVDEAETQLVEIQGWWLAQRPAAPTLVLEELEKCVLLLETSPEAGARFRRTTVPGVRRVVLPRTRIGEYYVHDEARAIVYVIAIWGAVRGSGPRLGDPR